MSKWNLRTASVFLTFGAMLFGQMSLVSAQLFEPLKSQPDAGVQQAGGPAAMPQSGAVEQTAWGLPMPKISMPKLTMPQISMPSMDAVTGPFKSGYGKFSSGSKKAWEGAKEMLSFGPNQTTSTSRTGAGSQQQPSFWHRLLVHKSEPTVPRTVGEFMDQPRVSP